jgi:hypothetical protein
MLLPITIYTYYSYQHTFKDLVESLEWSYILQFDIKETTFNFGYFTTISGHFFANYINIFHKT